MMHLRYHLSDYIRQLGNLSNASSELPERGMMDLIQAYRQSHFLDSGFQILWSNSQKEVFQYQELNGNAVKQHWDNEMSLTKPAINRMMETLRPALQTLLYLTKRYAMPKGKLHNHMTWCFKRFSDFADYVNHDHYVSHFNDAQYIRSHTMTIVVTSFQCNEQAVHMVSCTGSTRWRKYKPPRNGTVLLWMGTSPDSHIGTTAGGIPAQVMCLLVIADAELSFNSLLAFVQTFATGPIHQTAGMSIVEAMHQPPMDPLHNESYRHMPGFCVRTTYIIPISMIEGALHLLPLTPQPDSMWWYLSNTIDFNGVIVFYM